jgi:hypothetical protein
MGYTAGESKPESTIACLFSGGDGIDIHPPPGAIEADVSIHQRENCVIAAESYVFSWQKLRPTLADNDITGNDQLAAESFHTQPFADAVAAVFDAALSFFMSHWGSW